MANDDLFADTQKMLAAIDFKKLAQEQQFEHREELASLLRDLLDVADSLRLLEEHCQEKQEEGHSHLPLGSVQSTQRQLHKALARVGLQPLEAVGKDLDLDFHEVVSTRTGSEADIVLEDPQRGYLWRGALFRRAQVVVGAPLDSNASEGE